MLFPSTIEDTIAAVDAEGDIYQDNVRINSISFPNSTLPQLKAIACLFNSTLFSALARLKAGLSDSGWRQFNRQYAELVPFPASIFKEDATVKKLSGLADKISALQDNARPGSSEGAQTGLRASLESLWQKLDEAVEETYGLTREQRRVLSRYPRRVNRFELLFRQSSFLDEEE